MTPTLPPFHVVLLAGGTGSRMGGPIPKQFLQLGHQPVFAHSLQLLASLPSRRELRVVCDPTYHSLLPPDTPTASPGARRQDSLKNALALLPEDDHLVLIHDAARPFVTLSLVEAAILAAAEVGAATLALPIPFTVKASDEKGLVKETLDRSRLWQIQTPQVVRGSLLRRGFEHCERENLTVTDDVSLAELLNHPVKLVPSSPLNFKLTSAHDFDYAHFLLSK